MSYLHLYPPPTYFPRLGAGLEAERALWSRAPRPWRCNQLQSPGKNKMIILNLSALKEFILSEREINPELTKVQPFYWMGDCLCDIYIAGTCLALAQLLQTPCDRFPWSRLKKTFNAGDRVHKTELSNLTKNEIVLPPKHWGGVKSYLDNARLNTPPLKK